MIDFNWKSTEHLLSIILDSLFFQTWMQLVNLQVEFLLEILPG